MVESSGEPFMASSRHIPYKELGGGETEERHIRSDGLLQGVCRCQVVNRELVLVAGGMMLGQSLMLIEDNKDGFNCNRYGGCDYGGFGKEAEETNMSLGDEDNLGE